MNNINSEKEAREVIASWRGDPPMVQKRNLKIALGSLELCQMYYEQKGNDKGVARIQGCIDILLQRQADLEG